MSTKITTYSISVNSDEPPFAVASSDERGTGTHYTAADERGTPTHLPEQIVNALGEFMLKTKGKGHVIVTFIQAGF